MWRPRSIVVQRASPRMAAIMSHEAPSIRSRLIWVSCASVQISLLGITALQQHAIC